MNSIFSSFDVLSGEFLGKSVNYFNSKSPATSTVLVDQKTVKNESNTNSNSNVTRPRTKDGYSARWAPEFDGINCFESLVFL
ncbi:hypothetical protein R6Q57_006757 [Mikania cordata]